MGTDRSGDEDEQGSAAAPALPSPQVTEVLELRIHGVRNTPPHELLRSGRDPLKPEDVKLFRGDELAGFYRVKTEAAASGASKTHDHGRVPRVIEAYSWGHLARFTGIGIANRIAEGVVRTVWFLLMPFGLANAAYWSRPLPTVRKDPGTAAGRGPRRRARRRDGAGRIRLFALLLTLYFAVTAAVVAMDLIAVQCFPPALTAGEQQDRTCAALPSFLDGMAGWTRGERIAMMSLVPLAGVGLLAGVAYLARTRFHPRPNLNGREPQGSGRTGDGAVPALMVRNFWQTRKEVRYNGWLHWWASVGAVAAVVSWDGVWSRLRTGTAPVDSCGDPSVPELAAYFAECLPRLRSEQLDAAGSVMVLAWLLGVVAMIAAGAETVHKAADNPEIPSDSHHVLKRPGGVAVLGAASAVAAAVASAAMPCTAAVACDGIPRDRMLGMGSAPATLMLGMLLLIFSMLALKRNNYDRKALGWWGLAPVVLCVLALGAATIMSSAVVAVTVAFLHHKMKRREVSDDGMWRVGPAVPDVLVPPSVFSLFSGLLLAVVFLAPLIWGWCAKKAIRKMTWNTPKEAAADLADLCEATRPLPQEHVIGRKLVAARRKASLLHRAEAIAALLALLIGLGLMAALVMTTLQPVWNPDEAPNDLYLVLERIGGLGLAAVGAAILALAVTSAKPSARPFALLWDLMCFLPKAAHPYGPPSYGERAVPEFADRIAAWLDGADDAPEAGTGKVVVSAHSLGAVIAVCALFHLKARRPELPYKRIGMVTYGTQLRPYFGRFFPELFGPAVLAAGPARRTGLTAGGNPKTYLVDAGGPTGPKYQDLTAILGSEGGRWVNVYRKTDYLGFPVRYKANNDLPMQGDFLAQEMDPFSYQFKVTSHGDYLQTPQYERAVDRVLAALPD